MADKKTVFDHIEIPSETGAMRDIKTTAAAIFGISSNEVQSMGLKKKTEYKSGSGRRLKKT